MREILFKAKRIDNGEWVEGFYIKRYDLLDNEEHFIFHTDSYKVWEFAEIVPETLCQFTGLNDKNGKRIWEDDIVTCQTRFGSDVGRVVFHKGKFCVLWVSKYHYPKKAHIENYYDINTRMSVLGNIFDRPILLKEW